MRFDNTNKNNRTCFGMQKENYTIFFFHVVNLYHLAYNTLIPHVLHRLITRIFFFFLTNSLYVSCRKFILSGSVYLWHDTLKLGKISLTRRKCLLILNVFCRISIKTKRWDNQNILKETAEVERREWSQKRGWLSIHSSINYTKLQVTHLSLHHMPHSLTNSLL